MSVRHQSNLEVSHLLIEHGARIYENNIQGKRPLDLDPVSISEETGSPAALHLIGFEL